MAQGPSWSPLFIQVGDGVKRHRVENQRHGP